MNLRSFIGRILPLLSVIIIGCGNDGTQPTGNAGIEPVIHALKFDGNTNCAIVPYNSAFDLSGGDFTLEAYVFPEDFPGTWNWVIGHGTSNADLDYLLGFDKKRAALSVRSGASTLKATEALEPQRWYHIAGVHNATAKQMAIYIDGILVGVQILEGATEKSDGSIFIGAREKLGTGTPAEFFKGLISDVRVWNHVRSAEQINAGMNVNLTGDEQGLIAHWPIDEGGGSTLIDATGHGHDGALLGVPEWVEVDNPKK